MPGRTIDEAINNVNELPLDNIVYEASPQLEQSKRFNFEFLLTETGEGSVDDYLEHTLNFNRSKGTARIIRGMTGMLGKNLNLAIVDILIGALDVAKTKGATKHANIFKGESIS